MTVVVTLDELRTIKTDTPNRNLTLPVMTWELYDRLIALLEAQEAREEEAGN